MYVLPAKAVQNYCARTDFFSKVLAMSVDGEDSVTVLPKAVQYDPVTDCPIHIDFFRVSAHSEVKVSVPVEFIHADKSPAIKLGANLNIVMRTVHVLCSSSNIPEKFEIDLTGAGVGATFTVADLQVPDGCRVHTVSSAILANVVKAGQADAETSSSS
jgi:large subunit ribosomal protein L25